MTLLNASLRALFDALLFPFRSLPPIAGLLVVSLLTAVLLLLLYKATTDQEKLKACKRGLQAGLFEMRLYRDDLVALLRAQAEMLRRSATYLLLSLAPLCAAAVLLVPAVAQLQFHYGYRGLSPGQRFLVRARLAPAAGRPEARLEAPEGLAVETPAVWIPGHGELSWRVRAERWGDFLVQLRVGGETITKSVRVSRAVERRSPVRPAPGLVDQLWFPAEDPLPGGGALQRVAVDYPEAGIPILGWSVHWMIVFFVLSMLFALMLRGRMGVTL